MAWDRNFAVHECMDGTVNSARYRDILDNNLWPVIAKHFGNKEFLFQEDGASIHTSHLMGEYRASTNLPTIQWPAKSPDLNIIKKPLVGPEVPTA